MPRNDNKMKYYSLNHNAPKVSFEEAVIQGLATDKGLYFPESITPLKANFFENIENLSNEEIAFEAIKQFDSVTLYSGLPISAYDAVSQSGIIIKELDVYVESKPVWFFRKWKEVAHLQKHQSFYGMKDNLLTGYPKNNSARAALVKLIYFFTKWIHSDASILLAEKLQFLSFSKNEITQSYLKLLREDKPSHLFFTHQRPPFLKEK